MKKKFIFGFLLAAVLAFGSSASVAFNRAAIKTHAESTVRSATFTTSDIQYADGNANALFMAFKTAPDLEVTEAADKRYSANDEDGVITIQRGEETIVTGGLIALCESQKLYLEPGATWGFTGVGATFEIGDVITIDGVFTKRDGSGDYMEFDNVVITRTTEKGYRPGDHLNVTLGSNVTGADWWGNNSAIPLRTSDVVAALPALDNQFGYFHVHADAKAVQYVSGGTSTYIGTSVRKLADNQYYLALGENNAETHGNGVIEVNTGDYLILDGVFTNPYTLNTITFDGVKVYNDGTAWKISQVLVPSVEYTIDNDNTNIRGNLAHSTADGCVTFSIFAPETGVTVNGAWNAHQNHLIHNAVSLYIDGEGTPLTMPLMTVHSSADVIEFIFITWGGNYTGLMDQVGPGDEITIIGTGDFPGGTDGKGVRLTYNLSYHVDATGQLVEGLKPETADLVLDYTEADFSIYSVQTNNLYNDETINLCFDTGTFLENDTFPTIDGWPADWPTTRRACGSGDVEIVRNGEVAATLNSNVIKDAGRGYSLLFNSWMLPSGFTFQDKDIMHAKVDASFVSGTTNYIIKMDISFIYDDDYAGVTNYERWCLLDEYDTVLEIQGLVDEMEGKTTFTSEDGTKIKALYDKYNGLSGASRTWVAGYMDLWNGYFAQRDAEIATLRNTHLLLDTVGTDNHSDTGVCLTKYAEAKAYYLTMTEDAKWMICFASEHADALARLQQWALMNGEVFTTENNGTFEDHSSSSNVLMQAVRNENNAALIIVIASVTLVSLGALIVLKKRKSN